MQSYSSILAKFSFKDYNAEDNSPFGALLQFLMQEKAKSIYPYKQKLVKLQLALMKLNNILVSKDPKSVKEFSVELMRYQKKVRKYIDLVNQLDVEYKAYSDKLIAQAHVDMPKLIAQLIVEVESLMAKNLSPDVKALLMQSNGMPLYKQQLMHLMQERGVKYEQ